MMIVGPLSQLAAIMAEGPISRAISLLSPSAEFPDLGLAKPQHLKLAFHDIAEERPGYIAPSLDHVQQAFDFIDEWDGEGRVFVHCYAGVSRSTAIGYALACKFQPAENEAEIASLWRKASPEATPNARLIAYADDILGRNGRMRAAISQIGRGADCFEGSLIRWPVGGKSLPNS